MATGGFDNIAEDPNFRALARCACSLEDFNRLLDAHVGGYTQKRRLFNGLKKLHATLLEVETQIIIRASVKGKSSLDPVDQALYDVHGVDDLKEKMQTLSTAMQAAMDGGHLSAEEKPQVLEMLNAKLEAAEHKPNVQEKLRNIISVVASAAPYSAPMPECIELKSFKNKLKGIHALEAKPSESLTEYEQKKIDDKPRVKEALRALEMQVRMWFETDAEFKQRLEKSLLNATHLQLEQKRLQSLEKKQQLEDVCEHQAAAKKKGKKQFAKLDVFSEQRDEEHYNLASLRNELLKPAAAQPKKHPVSRPMVLPSKSIMSLPSEALESLPPVAAEEEPLQELTELPEAEPAPNPIVVQNEVEAPLPIKTTPPAQPKKEKKKKFTKLDPSTLGFK